MKTIPKQAKWAKERLEKRGDAPEEEGGDASKGAVDASKGLEEGGDEVTEVRFVSLLLSLAPSLPRYLSHTLSLSLSLKSDRRLAQQGTSPPLLAWRYISLYRDRWI